MVAEIQRRNLPAAAYTAQANSAYRFDWGLDGLNCLAPGAQVVVIVDVLRFTSAVSAAVEVGATVLPYRWNDDQAPAYAASRGAKLLGTGGDAGTSLSPTEMLRLPAGARVVLPSPNGSTLAFTARECGARHVLAGCLRNAAATARVARQLAGPHGGIAVIAAGERWYDTAGPVRPAVEDLIGAGAVLAALDPAASVSAPACSPEAAAARAAFVAARPRLYETLINSASGQELVERGLDVDVVSAAAHDVTNWTAMLFDEGFIAT
ncbi:MAG: 2-phosphosulfolactate phosphatase [Actinomycetota bacterium]